MNATPDDLDFMPETHAAEIEAVPVSLHLILWLTAGFLIVALVWAGYATLDEVARKVGRDPYDGRELLVRASSA